MISLSNLSFSWSITKAKSAKVIAPIVLTSNALKAVETLPNLSIIFYASLFICSRKIDFYSSFISASPDGMLMYRAMVFLFPRVVALPLRISSASFYSLSTGVEKVLYWLPLKASLRVLSCLPGFINAFPSPCGFFLEGRNW